MSYGSQESWPLHTPLGVMLPSCAGSCSWLWPSSCQSLARLRPSCLHFSDLSKTGGLGWRPKRGDSRARKPIAPIPVAVELRIETCRRCCHRPTRDSTGGSARRDRHVKRYASGLIADNCDVVTVRRALGHASATTTLRTYAHLWPTAEDRTRRAAHSSCELRSLLLRTPRGLPGRKTR